MAQYWPPTLWHRLKYVTNYRTDCCLVLWLHALLRMNPIHSDAWILLLAAGHAGFTSYPDKEISVKLSVKWIGIISIYLTFWYMTEYLQMNHVYMSLGSKQQNKNGEHVITSTEEEVFFFFSRIMQKVQDGFQRKLLGGCVKGQRRAYWILVRYHHCPNTDGLLLLRWCFAWIFPTKSSASIAVCNAPQSQNQQTVKETACHLHDPASKGCCAWRFALSECFYS